MESTKNTIAVSNTLVFKTLKKPYIEINSLDETSIEFQAKIDCFAALIDYDENIIISHENQKNCRYFVTQIRNHSVSFVAK